MDEKQAVESAPDRMMKWFDIEHLSGKPRDTSAMFADLAYRIEAVIAPGPERTVSLRCLLQAKDAAVRATVHPGG